MFKRKDPSQLQAQLAQLKGGGFEDSKKNEWKPTADQAGNGSAVIRFLPGKGDGLPFVKLVTHFIKNNGQYYAENCTSTHGDYDSCPVCAYQKANNVYETDKDLYQKIKRSTSYYANILVIKDPAKPENEGKVMTYRFGKKIYEKITAMIEVDADLGESPIDVTCVFGGANFALKQKKVSGYANYDDSKFGAPSQIANIEDPAFQKFLEESMVDLSTLTSPDKFKSLEENTAKFRKVMGTAILGAAAGAAAAIDKQLNDFDTEDLDLTPSAPVTPAADVSTPAPSASTGDAAIDDILNGLDF